VFACGNRFLYGAFAWACRARNRQKRRFPARVDATEVKLVVPAGSLVLCHQDLFHRGSRALVGEAPWRPMCVPL
jgi:hypothetical protein